MEIWFDDDLKDVRFQGFFEVARSVVDYVTSRRCLIRAFSLT
jgi:hypothetical protein